MCENILPVKGGVAGTDRQVENLKLHMALLHK